MSEMLGNRYLLELRFAEAIPHFESRLIVAPRDRCTAEKLALCQALAGDRRAATHWLHVALEAEHAEGRAEGVLWRELVSALEARREELGRSRTALGLALAGIFRERAPTPPSLQAALEHDPEIAWLHEVLTAVERQREASDEATH